MIPTGEAPYQGIYPSTVCPLRSDYTLDEWALTVHLEHMAGVRGHVGILCNGHAGENFLLSREEKRRVVEIACATIGDRAIIVAGINAENTLEAVEQALDAERAGADVLMIFAPHSWALSRDDDAVIRHHRMIVEVTCAPIMLFQASVRAGHLAYTSATLEWLVRLPRVIGVKEGSWEIAAYEANRRLVKRVAPEVAVFGSGDEHLLTSYVIGSEGSLVSLSVVIPEPIVALYETVNAGDLAAARRAHEVIQPLARAIYAAPPSCRATARLKACMRLLGRLPCDAVKPPVAPLPETEVAALRDALAEAGAL